jgi:hypothetical protein
MSRLNLCGDSQWSTTVPTFFHIYDSSTFSFGVVTGHARQIDSISTDVRDSERDQPIEMRPQAVSRLVLRSRRLGSLSGKVLVGYKMDLPLAPPCRTL